jgi:hypothetical protein
LRSASRVGFRESVAKVAAEEDPDDDIATSYKTMLDAIVSKRNQ